MQPRAVYRGAVIRTTILRELCRTITPLSLLRYCHVDSSSEAAPSSAGHAAAKARFLPHRNQVPRLNQTLHRVSWQAASCDAWVSEITALLTHFAVHEQVAASPQHQALHALLFLYREVLNRALNLPRSSPFEVFRAVTNFFVMNNAINIFHNSSAAHLTLHPTELRCPAMGREPRRRAYWPRPYAGVGVSSGGRGRGYPVVAAGEIADGRGVAAVLLLGTMGGWRERGSWPTMHGVWNVGTASGPDRDR